MKEFNITSIKHFASLLNDPEKAMDAIEKILSMCEKQEKLFSEMNRVCEILKTTLPKVVEALQPFSDLYHQASYVERSMYDIYKELNEVGGPINGVAAVARKLKGEIK